MIAWGTVPIGDTDVIADNVCRHLLDISKEIKE